MSAAHPPAQDGQPIDTQPGPRPSGTGPQRMPANVRAARVLALLLAASGLTLLWLVGTGGSGARGMGAVTPTVLLNVVLGVLALRYVSGRDGLRLGSILLNALQVPVSFLSLAGNPYGALTLIGNLVLIVLLARVSAKRWFMRAR
ncbi:hypothetical protein [Streptomyces sp. NPDC048172]|uniref:hypothetical protein n=1 Tax=Streptomyces sp. NPDC048172 TaxID=3365505 RepID=UPI0037213FF7